MNLDWVYGLLGGLVIGGATSVLLLGNGRIAGISGIIGDVVSGRGSGVCYAFLLGLIGVPALYGLTAGPPALTVTDSTPLLVAAGLLVGFGTQLGGGCTSGHGVCGISRLAPRGLAATVSFMVAGAVTVFVTRHLIGGL